MTLPEERCTDYDLVIVGAGIIGLILACYLQDQGLRIGIIDKETSNTAFSLITQLRFIAVTLTSQHSLQELNVWQRLNKNQCAPFRSMQVGESGQTAQLFFDSADIGEVCLGYIVNNFDLEQALYAQAKTDNELTWFAPDALVDMQVEEQQVLVTLASGTQISTCLLIGADGEQSKVRQLADLHIKATDYAQRALIATVQTERMHDETARQIFLANGPLAFLPLKDAYHCSIVWSNTPEEIQRLESMNDESFCEELTRVFEQCLGQVISTSARLSYPLKTQEAEYYVKSGVALIGDAAHTLHPLAGQGANLGMADAQCLAKVILEANKKHRSIGAYHTLRRYERERRFYNRVMMGGVDGIKYLFASPNPMIRKTRQFGLGLINKTACLKNVIARYAMGGKSTF